MEHLLLPEGCRFNDEHREFIRCIESRDVVACPGSGKTTALLAKILILASKMPFMDNRSLCVLTHTNVAIDLIKSKLWTNAEHLFRYPNFFGTIQAFTNKFLAIPAYIERYGNRWTFMGEDIYREKAEIFFNSNSLNNNKYISSLVKNKLKWKNSSEQKRIKIDFFINLDFEFSDNYISYRRGDTKTRKKILDGGNPSKNYSSIHSAKQGLLESGYLRFSDTFSLAKWYLDKWPIIKESMKQRFAFLLVDEAQDTDKEQLEILNSLFYSDQIITQYLGDPNQAIYRGFVYEDVFWNPKENPITFSDSKRFGKTITKAIEKIRVDTQISLKANIDINSVQPYILTYTEKPTDKKVLKAFAELIRKEKLNQNELIKDPIFKAVGWVGKDKTEEDKLCIRSYFRKYRKSIKNRKQNFSNLISYLYKPVSYDLKNEGAKIYRDAILRGIVRALGLGKVNHPKSNRPFTPQTFVQWMREDKESTYRKFLIKLSEWILKLHRGEKTAVQIKYEIASLIRKEQGIQHTDKLNHFLNDNEPEFLQEEQESSNIFKTDDGISIEVGTVHSVKGETHTATLYLETFYYDIDSKRLLPFLKGEYPQRESKLARHKENLKIAHVAFSRPTHLLVFACNEKNIKGHEKDLGKNGWTILKVE